MIRAFTKPESSAESFSDDTLNKSVINMHNMAADESLKNIEYLDNETAKAKIETLMNLVGNDKVFSIFTIDIQNEMKAKLTALLSKI